MTEYWSIPVIWDKTTCFILGGGPSLAKVDLRQLHDRHVIAVNDAYMLHQWDVMYFKDKNWYDRDAAVDDTRSNAERLKEFVGLKITNVPELLGKDPQLKVVKRGERRRLGDSPNKIIHGTNGGAEAIDVAKHFGATTICLVAFDMKSAGDAHNWHPNHTRTVPPSIYKDQYYGCFKAIRDQLGGVKVFNCTEGSALDVFPFTPLEQFL